MKLLCGIITMAMLTLVGCDTQTGIETTDRDNTEVNDRDADGHNKTPFDQSNTTEDTELVANIRSQVLEIEDLSTNGQNIKIITNNGKVVLRGPVNTDAERDAIVKVVNDVAGPTNVTSNLEVEKE